MNNPCELQAVVVSSDRAVVSSILPCLQELGIAPSVHTQPQSALETVARQKIDAFFVDRDLDPSLSVVKGMRTSPSSRHAVAFAIVQEKRSTAEASHLADFVIDKPLATVNMTRSVRAAYGFMLKERKRYFRNAVRVPVEVTDSKFRRFNAQTSNITQSGMAIQCAADLAARDIVQLEFDRPQIADRLSLQSSGHLDRRGGESRADIHPDEVFGQGTLDRLARGRVPSAMATSRTQDRG